MSADLTKNKCCLTRSKCVMSHNGRTNNHLHRTEKCQHLISRKSISTLRDCKQSRVLIQVNQISDISIYGLWLRPWCINQVTFVHSHVRGSTPMGSVSTPIVNRGEEVGEGVKSKEYETKNVSKTVPDSLKSAQHRKKKCAKHRSRASGSSYLFEKRS